jgi:DNA-directed RNA polymerase subunit N (RpoN/RPB10)
MIIPVRCFTCGKLLANKKQYYDKELIRKKLTSKDADDSLILNINIDEVKKTPAGQAMDDLGLTRMCCRKTMLTHIELITEI